MPLEPEQAAPADWQDSRDIEREPHGGFAPRYFRCTNPRCLRLVTDGQILLGGCICGTARLVPAGPLEPQEVAGLRAGAYPLSPREAALIQPTQDCVVTSIRD